MADEHPQQPTSVDFEGLRLEPSKYEEQVHDGDLAITLRATLARDETDLLRELQVERADQSRRYWPVVRRGVSEEPRRMRLGRVLWQQDGDRFEHLITLVDASADEKPPGPWLGNRAEPELRQAMGGLADLAGRFDALVDALSKAGLLNREAVEEIRVAGKEARTQRAYTFYEVDDLSRWE